MAGLSSAPLVGLLALGLAAACGSAEAPTDAQAFQPALAQPAAQALAERYAGTMPCADCAGIRVELTLNRDAASGEPTTYELQETYLGSMSPEGQKPFTQTGRWSIQTGTTSNPDATVYVLDGGGDTERRRNFERVSDQQLLMLDREQQRSQSVHAYALQRVPDVTLSFGTPAPGSAPAPAATAEPVVGAMVTDMATGWPVALQVGQDLTARLTANRSTGHGWTLRAGSDGGILEQQGEPAYEPAGDAKPGAGGVEVFRLKAVKPGQTVLAFDYQRQGDTAPTRSVTYTVTVQ